MAESTNIEVVSTIRLNAAQLRAGAEQAKGVYRDLRKEAEKPSEVNVRTVKAQAEVDKLTAKVRELQEARGSVSGSSATMLEGAIAGYTERLKALGVTLPEITAATTAFDTATSKSSQAIHEISKAASAAHGELDELRRAMTAETPGNVGMEARRRFRGTAPPKKPDEPSGIGGMEGMLRSAAQLRAALAGLEIGLEMVGVASALASEDAEKIAKGWDEAAKSVNRIPVVGPIMTRVTGQVHELVTGTQAYAEATRKSAAETDKHTESLRRRAEETGRLAESLRGLIAEENRQVLEEARAGHTPGQQQIAATDDMLRVTRARRKELEKQGVDVAEFVDLEKLLVARLNREIEKEQGEHFDRMRDLRFRDAEARLRAAEQDSAAERLSLSKQLQDEIDAEKDRGAQAELERQKPMRLNEFDQQTKKKIQEEEAEKQKVRDEARLRQEEKDASALERRTRKERDAVQKMNEEVVNQQDRINKFNAEARENNLRAAGKDYEADVERFSRAMDEKIAKATTAEERIAAEAAKSAGLRRMEMDRADKATRDRESRIRGASGFTSTRGLVERLNTSVVMQAALDRGSGGAQGTADDTPKKQLSALEQIVQNTAPDKQSTIRVQET